MHRTETRQRRVPAGPGAAAPAFSRSDGRRFGLSVGAAFLGVAALSLWRGYQWPPYAAAAAGGLLVLGALAAPANLGPVYRVWMALAMALSRVTTPVMMAVVYFLVIMPVGVVGRLFRRHPLRRAPTAGSYWIQRAGGNGGSDLRRQF